jgi:hypothetical protein
MTLPYSKSLIVGLLTRRQHTPPGFVGHKPDPETVFLGAICLIMNPQSKGSVRLHSSDPANAPLIDPSFLSHNFDRRVLIEGMKETKRLLSAPVYSEKTLKTYMPADDSDEAVWVRKKGDSWIA